MPDLTSAIDRAINAAQPLVDLIPEGQIIGFDVPDNVTERDARILQALACGLKQAEVAALFTPPITKQVVGNVAFTHKELLNVYKARTDIIYRSMLKSGLFTSLEKIASSLAALPIPETWADARVATMTAQVIAALMDKFDGQGAQNSRAKRSDVIRAIDRLKSLQSAPADSVTNDEQSDTNADADHQ